MSGTILSTLLFNQRLNKPQKVTIFDLFQYNVDAFNDFLERSDFGENEDKLKEQFSFDDEMMWDNVLKNYKSNNSVVSRMIVDRLWDGYTFNEDDDNKWADVFVDLFLDDYSGEIKSASIYYDWLNRWVENGKIFWNVNTSVWLEVIRRLHGRSDGYLGEIISYLIYDEFDESEIEEINQILGYEGEKYDEQTGDYLPSGEMMDFKEYVDNVYGGIKEFVKGMS